MKAIFTLLLLLGSSRAVAQELPAQPRQCAIPSVHAAIDRIRLDWMNGYNAGLPDKVAALYAPDATYLTQHFFTGIVHGRPAIRAYVKNGTDAHYRVDSLEALASDCSSDFAWAITRYRSTNGNQKAMGVNLIVIRKLKGKWLIVAHESAVPDPSMAIQKLEIVSPE